MQTNELLDLLLQRWRTARGHGRPLSAEELCAGCPELLGQLRRRIQELAGHHTLTISETQSLPASQSNAQTARSEILHPQSTDPGATLDDPSRQGSSLETLNPARPPTHAGSSSTTDPGATIDLPAGAAQTFIRQQVPGYEILVELGRGGMGVVYKAVQKSLKRLVALKMVLAGDDAAPEQLARFRTEAEAVAHLHHPNIVQIHEIGEHQGRPFISLEFVDGGPLTARLKKGPLPQDQAAKLIETLARAVQHAHQRGVVHRDLKPANVLLQISDCRLQNEMHDHVFKSEICDLKSAIPKITDFGLAKRLEDQDVGQTRTGAVMGTPSYMAPEQAEGKTDQIGPLVDVYALGAILYELLTGQPPFRGDTVMKILHKVLHDDVMPPSRLHARIDRDLETICLKALARDPRKRYPSALALAQDLERYQAGEPILARREGFTARLWRKVRKSPATAAALLGLVLAVAVAAFTILGASASRQINLLNQQIDTGLDASDWPLAHRDKMESLIAELETLDAAQAGSARQRLHDRFARFIHDSIKQPRLLAADAARIDHDVQWLTQRDPQLSAGVRDALQRRLRGWQTLFDVQAPFPNLTDVFAQGAVEAKDQSLLPRLPSWVDQQRMPPIVPTRFTCSSAEQLEARFDPSWENATTVGLALDLQMGHLHEVNRLAFSGDGKLLASGSIDHMIKIWDVATCKEIMAIRQPEQWVYCLAFSPDGKTLASGTHTSIHLWDTATGRNIASWIAHPFTMLLTFSPDGKQLASAGNDKTARIWDVTSLKPREAFKTPETSDQVVRVAWADQGRRLVTVNGQRRVQVWDWAAGKETKSWSFAAPSNAKAHALTDDGRTVAFSSVEGTRFFDAVSGEEKGASSWKKGEPGQILLAADGESWFAVFGHSFWSFPSPSAAPKEHLHKGKGHISSAALSPGADVMVMGLNNGDLIFWDLTTKKARARVGGQGYVFLLTSVDPSAAPPAVPGQKPLPPPSFQDVRNKGGSFQMQIVRNGLIQRREPAQVGSGPLKLLVHREANKLEFQVNDAAPLVFYDAFPLRGGGGFYGVHWPRQARLTRLHAQAQTLPGAPSPLERADDLFDKGQFSDALALFQSQAQTAASPAIQHEARCKAGLCLAQLNRLDQAAEMFAPLMNESGERWPLVAVGQLLLIRLQQNRFDDMDALLANIRTRFRFEQLAGHIPDHLRKSILDSLSVTAHDFLLPEPGQVHKLEQCMALADLFQETHALEWAKHNLVRMRFLLGQEKEALVLAKEVLPNPDALDINVLGHIYRVRVACWLMRRQGETRAALDYLDRLLFTAPGVYRKGAPAPEGVPAWSYNPFGYLPLLADRARLNIALGNLERAEKDVDDLIRLDPVYNSDYAFRAAPYLIKGFLLEQKGYTDAARQVWKDGLYQNFLAKAPPDLRKHLKDLPQGDGLIMHLTMASLANSLSDAEANAIFDSMLERLGGTSFLTQMAGTLRIAPDVFRDMWRTPRGKELARKMAYLDLPLGDYYRQPFYLTVVEKFRKELFTAPLTPEQEQLLWQCVPAFGEAFFQGKLSKGQFLQLGLAWKGTTGIFGWGGVAPKLDPVMRGPFAYILGRRSLNVNRDADALMYFQAALKDAPANSPLYRLAQAELTRLQKK